MALALFDLDNTLIRGDSDYEWGLFIVDQGLVEKEYYSQQRERFYQDYLRGELDIELFQSFQQAILTRYEPAQLFAWREQFVAKHIHPLRLAASDALLAQHRQQGDTLLIVTATNHFITETIARWLGVETLIATETGMIDGRYTGKMSGVPCYKEGKIERLRQWCEQHGVSLEGATFYSDSHNDIPLLEFVTHPVAADPDATLEKHAQEKGWPIITLRHGPLPVSKASPISHEKAKC